MACSVPKEERLAYVQRAVRLSIKEVDGGDPPPTVTQDTLLGSEGLGHAKPKRRRYHAAIAARLADKGCAMGSLTPESFADDALKRVRDVTALVLADLK